MILTVKHSKLILGLAVFALVAAGVAVSVEAQGGPALPAQGTKSTCSTTMTHIGNLAGASLAMNTVGPITVQFGQQFKTSDGRSGIKFAVTDMTSTGDVQGFGPAVFRLDRERASSGDYTAARVDTNFPGTQRLSLNITLETGGRLYRSLNPATLVSTGVTALPPQPGSTYFLANSVRMEDVSQPGNVALELEPGQAAVVGDAN